MDAEFQKVVQVAFTKEEWEFLMSNGDFSQRMKYCCNSTDDVFLRKYEFLSIPKGKWGRGLG